MSDQPPVGPPAPPAPPTPPRRAAALGGIDWVKVIAGALAAISSAVLLSTLGAAGTLIGAALGSVIVSVTSSLYSQGLARSRAQLAEAQDAALRKVGMAQAEVRRARRRAAVNETPTAEAHLQYADRQLADARVELAGAETAGDGWTDRVRALPWKRVAVIAVGFFVAAVAAITIFELVADRPLSSYFNGDSGHEHGPSLVHLGGSSKPQAPAPKPTPPPSTPPAPTPSGSPSPTLSTPTPTPSTAPTTSPTSTPTPPPSSNPTPSLGPSLLP